MWYDDKNHSVKKGVDGTMRILIVDDEPLMLRKMDTLVGKLAPEAERRSFSDTALLQEYLAEFPVIDVAFLDINIGDWDGVSAARALQRINPSVNIIFCTGYSQYALDAVDLNCSGYLLKPITLEAVQRELSHLRFPVPQTAPAKGMQVRCFGAFSAAVQGKELHFSYGKTKELLAYLVDRRGTMCGNNEIQAVLWEDGEHSEYLKSLRKDLRRVLTENGCEAILESRHGGLRIVPEMISCDYYDYLDGKPVHFQGEYMTGYEFADETREILTEQQH